MGPWEEQCVDPSVGKVFEKDDCTECAVAVHNTQQGGLWLSAGGSTWAPGRRERDAVGRRSEAATPTACAVGSARPPRARHTTSLTLCKVKSSWKRYQER